MVIFQTDVGLPEGISIWQLSFMNLCLRNNMEEGEFRNWNVAFRYMFDKPVKFTNRTCGMYTQQVMTKYQITVWFPKNKMTVFNNLVATGTAQLISWQWEDLKEKTRKIHLWYTDLLYDIQIYYMFFVHIYIYTIIYMYIYIYIYTQCI